MRIQRYGVWVFVLTPFAMGACAGFIYNRGRDATERKRTTSLVVGDRFAACLVLLFTAAGGHGSVW